MRKLLTLLLAAVLVLTMASCGVPAAEPTAPASTEATAEAGSDIVILHTNDVHTYVDSPISYDVLAAVKRELEKQYDYVLLADAGDAIQGTAYGAMDQGETIIRLMNAAGYDVATLGNHEFDYGMESTMDVVQWAEYPYVSCNFRHEKDGVPGQRVLEPYVLFPCGTETVAFVGITTPESFVKAVPAFFQDEQGSYIYGISGGEDGAALYADVQRAIDEAKAAGATKVVALGHLGDDASSGTWTSEATIAAVSGLTAFLDGHSHSTVVGKEIAGKDGKPVVLSQTGEHFGHIGMMVLKADGTVVTDLITAEEVPGTAGYRLVSELYTGPAWPVEAAVADIKNDWIEQIDERLGAVIGTAQVALGNYDADGNRLVRKQETNTGDFCTDALYYLFDSMGMDVDAAILGGGVIRNMEPVSGEITYKLAREIHTFGNMACLQAVTGQQLLDALEWGARGAGEEEIGGFLQVAGITYAVDTAWPESTRKDEKGVWIGAPTGGYRVHDVMVFNRHTGAYEPLDLQKTYNLAGHNYTLQELGDGFNMFSGSLSVCDNAMEDYMVLAHYVQGFEGGVVDAANSPLLLKCPAMKLDYSHVNGSGRITFKDKE